MDCQHQNETSEQWLCKYILACFCEFYPSSIKHVSMSVYQGRNANKIAFIKVLKQSICVSLELLFIHIILQRKALIIKHLELCQVTTLGNSVVDLQNVLRSDGPSPMRVIVVWSELHLPQWLELCELCPLTGRGGVESDLEKVGSPNPSHLFIS